MPELILILNINNERIHSFERNLEEDNDYCKLYLLAYSCLDIINILVNKSNNSFFYCLIKSEYIVSLFLMKNGSRILVVSKEREKENVKLLCEKIYLIYKKYFLKEINEKIKSKEFLEEINKLI
ncbi:hypothetical protein TUBRATIS_20920 [Tubulinosema ratisbonensis]|uniref:Uncharacterized protein n=1 Tax=Tubulinosema ratisbonensis TaxID=291195 RepID=A0A437AK65_9MICR|nr:hypothetical protein TUBRATIS_20920 [Tubulinosema ratisbonensis]